MVVPVRVPYCRESSNEGQTTEPPPPISCVTVRLEQKNLLAEMDDFYEETLRPFNLFFEIADTLRCSGASDDVCTAVLMMAKLYWRHETCQYFSGIFA